MLLVRPDDHVSWAGPTADLDGLLAHLDLVLPTGRSPTPVPTPTTPTASADIPQEIPA